MKKSEQNWVVVIKNADGSIRLIGTASGGAFTRNGAWILEREMQLANPTESISSAQLEKSGAGNDTAP